MDREYLRNVAYEAEAEPFEVPVCHRHGQEGLTPE
jgi:hypothetical protein